MLWATEKQPPFSEAFMFLTKSWRPLASCAFNKCRILATEPDLTWFGQDVGWNPRFLFAGWFAQGGLLPTMLVARFEKEVLHHPSLKSLNFSWFVDGVDFHATFEKKCRLNFLSWGGVATYKCCQVARADSSCLKTSWGGKKTRGNEARNPPPHKFFLCALMPLGKRVMEAGLGATVPS